MYVHTIQFRDPASYAASLAHHEGFIWLDSHDDTHPHARFTTLAINPIKQWKNKEDLSEIEQYWHQERTIRQTELPPFQGGMMGFLAYDWGLRTQGLSQHRSSTDDLIIGHYPTVLSFDLHQKRCWIISQDWDHHDALRAQTARKTAHVYQSADSKSKENPLPLHFTPWQSNQTEASYMQLVKNTQEAIQRGDFFQANITQAFSSTQLSGTPFQTYCQWRQKHPSPYSAFFQWAPNKAIASISPEHFLSCHQGRVETSPIKGTAPRSSCPQQNKKNRYDLQHSQKDHAENTMIVDLMRNDLSMTCEDDSIEVPSLCHLETFSQVHHLVSRIQGQLKTSSTPWQLLASCFPGGSITGAPKHESMRWIHNEEGYARKAYCGSMIALGTDGTLSSSILIRSILFENNQLLYGAGGAITLQSDPREEYLESCTKARAFCELIEAYS